MDTSKLARIRTVEVHVHGWWQYLWHNFLLSSSSLNAIRIHVSKGYSKSENVPLSVLRTFHAQEAGLEQQLGVHWKDKTMKPKPAEQRSSEGGTGSHESS
eukprot:1043471-Amphidinium_carterae.2